MTTRTMSSEMAAALGERVVRPVDFAFLDFPTRPARVCSLALPGGAALQWGGYDWQGMGGYGRASAIEETADMTASKIMLQLANLPPDQVPYGLVAEILEENYRNREMTLWRGCFDEQWSLIASPVMLWTGRMDAAEVVDGPQGITVTVIGEHELRDLRRPRAVYYTDQEQQDLYSGDKGCEYAPALQRLELCWGGVKV